MGRQTAFGGPDEMVPPTGEADKQTPPFTVLSHLHNGSAAGEIPCLRISPNVPTSYQTR